MLFWLAVTPFGRWLNNQYYIYQWAKGELATRPAAFATRPRLLWTNLTQGL